MSSVSPLSRAWSTRFTTSRRPNAWIPTRPPGPIIVGQQTAGSLHDPTLRRPTQVFVASARARLLNRAKAERRPFSELLQYYGMERFLYRLSRSDHAEHFVLEGALMLQFWGAPLTRATKDIDLLGRDTRSVEQLVAVVKDCLMLELEDDGLRFDPETIQGNEIGIDAKYDGVRLTFVGFLGTARIHLQVDVDFGDVITPGAQELDYPTLLGLDAPRLLGYTPETAIAEKFHAMVVLDMANTARSATFVVARRDGSGTTRPPDAWPLGSDRV
jgi:hypothetical protein